MASSGKQALKQRERVLDLLKEGRSLWPSERYPKAFNERHAHFVWGLTQGLSYAEAMGLAGYAYETAKKLQETRAVAYARMQYRRERATEVRTMMEDRALSMAEDMIKLLKPKDLVPIVEKHSNATVIDDDENWAMTDETDTKLASASRLAYHSDSDQALGFAQGRSEGVDDRVPQPPDFLTALTPP